MKRNAVPYIVAILLWAACVALFFIGPSLAIFSTANAQSPLPPQNSVRISYVQCPSHMKYDPTQEYTKYRREMGTVDNPVTCHEIVDYTEDKTICQIAFVCEDGT